MRTGLRAVFVLQLFLAAMLIFSDTATRWSLPGATPENAPTGPFSPGDQRRLYRQDETRPAYLLRDAPDQLPKLDAMPDRLQFTSHEIDGFGVVIQAAGAIEDGDTIRFKNFLDTLSSEPDLIALNSPGGLVFEAQTLGRLIRERKYDTAVLSGAGCVSSCPYVLAAGTERFVSRGGAVGMHQHYYEAPRYLPVMFAVTDIQAGQGKTMEYLIEMGIDPSIMVHSLKTPPEQIYLLVEEELEQTKIATKIID